MSDEEYQGMVSYYNKLVEEMPCPIIDTENFDPFVDYKYHPHRSITPTPPFTQKGFGASILRKLGKHVQDIQAAIDNNIVINSQIRALAEYISGLQNTQVPGQ